MVDFPKNDSPKPETAPSGPKNGALSPKQEAAAVALAAGRTIEQAARAGNSGTRTLKTWLHDQPAFVRRVAELRAEMTSRALGRLVDAMASAAETLGYLSCKGKSEMVRLGAARAVLELGTKLRESAELEERIAALEGSAEQRRIA
jgi:hypothetical protein